MEQVHEGRNHEVRELVKNAGLQVFLVVDALVLTNVLLKSKWNSELQSCSYFVH